MQADQMKKTFDPFDELAAMFLTTAPQKTAIEAEGSEATSRAPRSAPDAAGESEPGQAAMNRRAEAAPPAAMRGVKLVIAGNLPVRGGLWLTPYADALARDHGSTALLRLDGDEPNLQLFRAPVELGSMAIEQSLEDAIGVLGAKIDLWIVRPYLGCAPGELIQSGAERITILSSADEGAVVAAYQLIKELSQAAEQSKSRLPALNLAVIGTDAANAAGVVERLNRTTLSFLGAEIKLGLCLPRMDAGIKSTRYVSFPGQQPPSVSEVIMWIEKAKAGWQRPDVAERRVAGQIYIDREQTGMVDAERILQMPAPRPPRPFISPPAVPRVQPEPSAPICEPVSAATHHEHVAPRIKLAPKPTVDVEPKAPAKPLEPDEHGQPIPLARYVKGLTTLPIRSPGRERVELAVDGTGRLHLLSRDLPAGALREMRIVECWVKAHRELIAMACPQPALKHNAKAVCHVFSAEPVAVSDLHATDVHLHVLAPVEVNGQTGWYCAPLNAVSQ